MFDNFRDSASSSFYEEEPNDLYKEPMRKDQPRKRQQCSLPGYDCPTDDFSFR